MSFQALFWSLLQLQSTEMEELTVPQNWNRQILNRGITWKESCAVHRWRTAPCIVMKCQSWAWAFMGAIFSTPLSLGGLKEKDADSHTAEQGKLFILCVTDRHKWTIRARAALLQLGGAGCRCTRIGTITWMGGALSSSLHTHILSD